MKHISLLIILFSALFLQVQAVPSLLSSVPSNNQQQVSVQSRLVLTLSESVQLGEGNATLNGSVVEPLTQTQQYLIFAPVLDYFCTYELHLPAGYLKSTSGESEEIRLRFTTAPEPMPNGCNVGVAQNGSRQYVSIQEAIDAAPSYSDQRFVIFVDSGSYASVHIPEDKPNITLWGKDRHRVHIRQEAMDKPAVQIDAEGSYLFQLGLEAPNGAGLEYRSDKNVLRFCRIEAGRAAIKQYEGRLHVAESLLKSGGAIVSSLGKMYVETSTLQAVGAATVLESGSAEHQPYGLVLNASWVQAGQDSIRLVSALSDGAMIHVQQTALPSLLRTDAWDDHDFTSVAFSEYMNYGLGARRYPVVYMTEAMAETVLLSMFEGWDPYDVLRNTGKQFDTWIEGAGYGANRGGNGGQTVTVSTEADLRSFAASNHPTIIRVQGTIHLSQAVGVGSNTTITGVDESSTIVGNLYVGSEARNVIIQYLNITHPGELKANDGISIEGAKRVLVRHVSLFDCSDGTCDTRNGADSITVAWNKIYYVNQLNGHRYTMIADGVLIRNDMGEVIDYGNPLHITFHHNWWSTLCDQRMPSSTNAHAHLYNNYWAATNNYYCSLARTNSEFYSEQNFYQTVRNPIYNDGFVSKIYTSGNVYRACFGSIHSGRDAVAAPAYDYIPGSAADVPSLATARSGNVRVDPSYVPTHVKPLDATGLSPKMWFDSNGLRVCYEAYVPGTELVVYTLQGLCVARVAMKQAEMDVDLPDGNQVYVVRLGGYSRCMVRN